MRVSVYVDGFNLYYAIRQRGYKWLDLKALAVAVLPPKAVLNKINYYTARVSGAVDPGAPARQQTYLNALSSIPELEVFQGHFLAKPQWRPLLNLPIADRDIAHGPLLSRFPECAATVGVDAGNPNSVVEAIPIGRYRNAVAPPRRPTPMVSAIKARVFAMEEKGSDVNLAVHLVNDAWAKRFDAAAVLTNDTDLVEPIRIVVKERGIPVYLLCAHQGASAPLRAVASSVRHIRDAHLAAAQFPNPVIDSSGRPVTKPAGW